VSKNVSELLEKGVPWDASSAEVIWFSWKTQGLSLIAFRKMSGPGHLQGGADCQFYAGLSGEYFGRKRDYYTRLFL